MLGAAALSLEMLGTIKPQTVNAATHSFYWWEKPRTVRITKNHKIYEIQAAFPRSDSYKIGSKTLKKGTLVKINHGVSWLWIVSGHGLANNYSKGNGRFWVANGSKGWYSLNLHPKAIVKTASKKSAKTKTAGTYTSRGSIHQYADSNVHIRLNTNQFHYVGAFKQLVVPMTVRSYMAKTTPIAAIVSKYMEISDQHGNLVSFTGARGSIKQGHSKFVELTLDVANAKTLFFAFPKSNQFFTYDLPAQTNSSNSNTNKTNQSAIDNYNNERNAARNWILQGGGANSTTSTNSSTQFQWPAGVTGYMAKAQYLFSLSGEQRRAADLALMKELGDIGPNGKPLVGIPEFEAHLREMYNNVNSFTNYLGK